MIVYRIASDRSYAGPVNHPALEPLPDTVTATPPPSFAADEMAYFVAGEWIVRLEVPVLAQDHLSLETLRTTKITDLTAACQAAILGGFASAALGALHQYPSQFTDQINLMGSVTASLLPDVPVGWVTPFWCVDEGGVWLMRLHSAEQIRQAGRDGKAHVLACQQVLDALVLDAGAAETAQAIADIVWPGTA